MNEHTLRDRFETRLRLAKKMFDAILEKAKMPAWSYSMGPGSIRKERGGRCQRMIKWCIGARCFAMHVRAF